MCFSAQSSFAAATVLTGVGFVSLRQVRHYPKYYMLASVPLIFALQQAAEGVVWLTLNNPQYTWLHQCAGLLFIIIAQVLWPIWNPIGLLMFETHAYRKKILGVFSILGILVGSYSAYILATTPLTILETCNSLYYDFLHTPLALQDIYLFLYTIPTVMSLFVTQLKLGWFLGVALIAALFASWFFKAAALGSVWCFCAAILSIFIIVALRKEL